MPVSVQQTEQPAAIRARSRTADARAAAAVGKTVRERARTPSNAVSENVVPSRAASVSSRGLALRDITNNDGGRGTGGKAFSFKAGAGKQHSSAHVSAQPAGCGGYGRPSFTQVGEQQVQSQAKSAPRWTSSGTEVLLNVCDADVGEYLPDIMDQCFRQEANFRLKPSYMEAQLDINGKMRGILVDWLVEVHMKYKLRRETLYLTVRLIDRYLSQETVARKCLQLVGVCAMLIGAKFEEIQPPEVHDFVYITDNAYTKKDILDMERAMLLALSFKIVASTEAHFLDPLMCANRCDDRQREVVQYLLELSLHDLKMVRYLPSHLVAAALLLSNELLDQRSEWPASMVRASRWEAADLRACASELRALLMGASSSPLQAVRKKYGSEQHKSVAKMFVGTAWVA